MRLSYRLTFKSGSALQANGYSGGSTPDFHRIPYYSSHEEPEDYYANSKIKFSGILIYPYISVNRSVRTDDIILTNTSGASRFKIKKAELTGAQSMRISY